MLIKPLILGFSIDFGLLAIALTLRFIIYPFYCWCHDYRIELKEKKAKINSFDETIEIKSKEITINST